MRHEAGGNHGRWPRVQLPGFVQVIDGIALKILSPAICTNRYKTDRKHLWHLDFRLVKFKASICLRIVDFGSEPINGFSKCMAITEVTPFDAISQ